VWPTHWPGYTENAVVPPCRGAAVGRFACSPAGRTGEAARRTRIVRVFSGASRSRQTDVNVSFSAVKVKREPSGERTPARARQSPRLQLPGTFPPTRRPAGRSPATHTAYPSLRVVQLRFTRRRRRRRAQAPLSPPIEASSRRAPPPKPPIESYPRVAVNQRPRIRKEPRA
jgi:hypothetical protein